MKEKNRRILNDFRITRLFQCIPVKIAFLFRLWYIRKNSRRPCVFVPVMSLEIINAHKHQDKTWLIIVNCQYLAAGKSIRLYKLGNLVEQKVPAKVVREPARIVAFVSEALWALGQTAYLLVLRQPHPPLVLVLFVKIQQLVSHKKHNLSLFLIKGTSYNCTNGQYQGGTGYGMGASCAAGSVRKIMCSFKLTALNGARLLDNWSGWPFHPLKVPKVIPVFEGLLLKALFE